MIHIVFQEADVHVLSQAILLDESLQGDVIQIKDDFAVGPLSNIYEVDGYQARRDWWVQLLEYSPYKEQLNIVDDKLTVHHLIQALKDGNELWIWLAPNAHDVCGYYWLISQLKDFAGKICILSLNNLPFINEKGSIFYPSELHEILPKEFLKAKKLARAITPGEFEIDPDEWKKICTENAMIRLLDGGKKITAKEVSFYDKDILSSISDEFQKLQKVLNILFVKLKIKTGDVFLVWRIRELLKNGILECTGDWHKGWKDIELRKPTNNEPETE